MKSNHNTCTTIKHSMQRTQMINQCGEFHFNSDSYHKTSKMLFPLHKTYGQRTENRHVTQILLLSSNPLSGKIQK
jgi:hypothetical protein